MSRSDLLLNIGRFQTPASTCAASDSINKLIDIYQECLFYPYSSAASYYVLNGISTPENFGTDCAGQAKLLKHKLHEASIFAKYIDDKIIGRHRSLLCDVEGRLYYMTTYLMHQFPVLLNSASLVVPSLPIAHGFSSDICIEKNDFVLDVKKTWANSCRIDRFIFDINSATNEELSRDELMRRLIHPEQKTISIRVIDSVNAEVLHYVMQSDNADRTYSISSLGMSPNKSSEYRRVLRRISELISSSSSEIQDYIHGAFQIRKSILLTTSQ